MDIRIPVVTIYRLSSYSMFLSTLEKAHIEHVSSVQIAEGVGSTPAKVRKDLSYFGDFGKRGVGYDVSDLNKRLKKLLGTDREWKTILIGAGNLGTALATYAGFSKRGYRLEGIFDSSQEKIGQKIGKHSILSMTELTHFIEEEGIEIAIITVPVTAAQSVADLLAETEISGILNFAPMAIKAPKHIVTRNLDLGVELEIISFMVQKQLMQDG